MKTVIDLKPLLAEISPEAPSGETDPGDDFAFAELDRKIKGTPARYDGKKMIEEAKEPNWREIQTAAMELLTRAHDLRVAMFLTRALVHTRAMAGLHTGLDLIGGFIERYWDNLYPHLDSGDNNDPTERINILWTLDDRKRIIEPLKKVTLFSPQPMIRIALRDIDIAKEAQKGAAMSAAMIDEAFKDCNIQALQTTREAVNQSVTSLKRLEDLLIQKVGKDAPSFNTLTEALEKMKVFFDQRLPDHPSFYQLASSHSPVEPENNESSVDSSNKSSATRMDKPMEMISNRKDVIHLLDQICIYYDQHEPASPVPLLLKRARQLVEKNFFEIVQDLAPDAASQVKTLIGGVADKASK